MNENITNTIAKLLINAPDSDVEKLSVTIIEECSKLIDSWSDSGRYTTFGERLNAHFGVAK